MFRKLSDVDCFLLPIDPAPGMRSENSNKFKCEENVLSNQYVCLCEYLLHFNCHAAGTIENQLFKIKGDRRGVKRLQPVGDYIYFRVMYSEILSLKHHEYFWYL